MRNETFPKKTTNKGLYGGVAAAVIVAALLGFGIAKMTSPATPKPAAEEAAEPAAPKALTVKAETIQQAGILVQTVDAGGLSSEILAQGSVMSAPSGQAVMTARAGGTVTQIFKRLGDPVKAGESLALVSSNDAAQIAADRRSAAAKATLAQQTLAREKSLFEQGITPKAEYEQAVAEAAAAQADQSRANIAASNAGVTSDGRGTRVISPISGRITAATASLGAFVQPETELFRVSDPAKTQVEAAISAVDAPRVAPGDRVSIDMGDGQTVEGRVRSVTPALDAATRTATAVIDAPGAQLVPGRSVRVRMFLSGAATGGTSAIVVPEESVQSVDGKDVVFVRTKDGFRPQAVITGQRSGGRIEIVSGLPSGSAIATKNAFLLKAEISKSAEEE
ncbi:efflux RND transporter periplasmic adaptor subunit [Asticcacaulis sp.]|uniref:efflux RND transporter periplasmic adaptor subunit n=1 Tax=Asticcacaulis sp. TaxID=1872648 RepID=UPI003F7CC000